MNIKEQAYNIFNSEGKLIQVEYALEAVYNSHQIVCIKTEDSIVAVSKILPREMLCMESHTSIFKITDGIYINITGGLADIDYVVNRIRTLASKISYSMGGVLTSDILCREIADKFQEYIQRSGKRAPAFAMGIFGFEKETPILHYTDLSAVEYPCYAMSAGSDHGKMNKYLEKHFKMSIDINQAIELGISTLLQAIGRDSECSEIEVAILKRDGIKYMTQQEVELVLQQIAEKQ